MKTMTQRTTSMKNVLLMTLGLLLPPLSSQAFTLNSSTNPQQKGWASSNITIYVNTSNCPASVDVVSIISDAIRVWNNVSTSSVSLSYGGTTTSTAASNPPIVYCETNFSTVTGADNNSVPGAASVSTSNNQIVAGFIVLNVSTGNANIANKTTFELTTILAHEIGHLIGLGHSQTANALMYYTYSYKTSLNLAQDDVDGISYLYPSDELSKNKYAGCSLVKDIPPPSQGGMTMLLLCLIMPLAVWTQLRKRPYQPRSC